MSRVKVITENPTVIPIAAMEMNWAGVSEVLDWVKQHRPECVPPECSDPMQLFPHRGIENVVEEGLDGNGAHVSELTSRNISGNELLVEFAGRKCYDSFGAKAGKKDNKSYIQHTQEGQNPHASILYHAKTSFFVAGVSRRLSHELIRNYVGADRDQEGNPSQESTRFTHHYGWYVAHPRDVNDPVELAEFLAHCEANYDRYESYIKRQVARFTTLHGKEPKGLDRKRIYESAADRLLMAAETSFVWTTNPAAFAKMYRERSDLHADLEFQRLVKVWKEVYEKLHPNLLPSLNK